MNLEKLKAYELVEEKDLKDLNSKGYLFRHKKSGQQAIHHIIHHKIPCKRRNFCLTYERLPAHSPQGESEYLCFTVMCLHTL